MGVRGSRSGSVRNAKAGENKKGIGVARTCMKQGNLKAFTKTMFMVDSSSSHLSWQLAEALQPQHEPHPASRRLKMEGVGRGGGSGEMRGEEKR